jgi:hypothetical protein
VIKSKIMRQEKHVAHKGDRRGAYRVSIGTHDKKRPLGTPRNKWIILK